MEWLAGGAGGLLRGGRVLPFGSPGPRPQPYAEKHRGRSVWRGARQGVFWSPWEASVFEDR